MSNEPTLRVMEPGRLLGGLEREARKTALEGAAAYVARKVGEGLGYTFPAGALAGALAGATWLSAEFLLEGVEGALFLLMLREGEEGPAFSFHFGLLNECGARMRLPLSAVNQNRWMFEREGAWLKPLCGGARVDLAKVDRMSLTVMRKGDGPVRWAQTAVTVWREGAPARLEKPVLPKGPLIDEMGQWTLRDWEGKSRSTREVSERLEKQLAAADGQRWPEMFSAWGGWKGRRVEGKGFFRTHHDGKRWWLVDPEGYLFWSAGQDCVRATIDANVAGLETALKDPPAATGEYAAAVAARRGRSVDYLKVNFIRAFGAEKWHEAWAKIALAELRRTGFNTVANWSEWQEAQRARFPYVRPLDSGALRGVPQIYRDFPDVFDPAFTRASAQYAMQLRETAEDPALIGYFLMNEPTWGFSTETPAAGMLFNTERCATRDALAAHLRQKYADDGALARGWEMPVTMAKVAAGRWAGRLSRTATADLANFSTAMVERLFHTLSDACRAVDPKHLNLGARYHTVPPKWALMGMTCFDVFSINCYQERVPRQSLKEIDAQLHRPVLIGEWHFGALDAGLPASGIGRVATQADRGKAYRVYLEDAAEQKECVGVHYFTLYDQSALGRGDGENYNIGFMDVCNRPYEALATAARASHERMYAVATGELKAYDQAPKYLPKLFY